MNQTPDRVLADWLTDGPDQGPRHGLDRTLAATRRTTQRPAWTFASTWVPAPLATRAFARPRSFAILLAAVLLVVALAATALFVASRPPRTAPPFGLAGNGTILLDVDGQLWQANADGSNPRPFAAEHLGRAYSPIHSPDGTRIAFLTQADIGKPPSIFVANADGSGARNVTGDMKVVAGPLDVPAWSPDGSRLAFTSSDNGNNTQIYTVGADGSGLTAVPHEPGNRQYPSWSPDGEWLAYQLKPLDWSEGTHLAISRPDGSDERRLASVSARDASFAAPQWNPDSRRLAYFTSSYTDGDVGVVDLDRTRTRLSRDGEIAFNPVWSADGRLLHYATNSGSTVVDLDDPSKRVDIPAGLADCGAVWAPDATAILGLGLNCENLFRIPLADPTSATPVDVPAGGISIVSWQRTAP